MADDVKTEKKKDEVVEEQPEVKADKKKAPEPAPTEEHKKEEAPAEKKPEEAPAPESKTEAPKEAPAPEAAPEKPEKPAAEEKPEKKEEAKADKVEKIEEPAKKEPVKKEAPEPPAQPKEEKPKAAKPEKKETPKPKAEKPDEKPAPEPAKEEKTEEKEEAPADGPAEDPEKKEKVKGPKKPVGLPPDKVLLFGKYNLEEVVIHDPGPERYLNIDPIMVPHTGAKHANKWFGKSRLHIIERLLNNMMRTEEYTGKKSKAYKVVKEAFEIIEKRTKSHPVQVLVDALENSAPREEVTRLRYGGISVPKAVDTSSSRRLDIAFRNICKGAISSSYKNSKSIEVCLANEIILASKKDMNSFAVNKKEELERIAASAR